MYATASGDGHHHQILQHCRGRPCLGLDRRWKPNVELAPNCPRCASSNTKFCYYNNYSLSQPRYFCKSCRRYWTKGGSLRNVPVGGGCRKGRRSKAAAARGPAVVGSSSNSPSSPGQAEGDPSNGPDIDLAEVFAKFLSESPGSEHPGSAGSGSHSFLELPVSLNQDTQLDDVIEGLTRPGPVGDSDQVLEGLPDDQVVFVGDDHLILNGGERSQAILGSGSFLDDGFNSNPLGLHTMLGDELMGQDILWHDPTNVPTYGWQLPVAQQFQDLGPFPSDIGDQMGKISSNIVSENWGLFDLTGFEVFSGP